MRIIKSLQKFILAPNITSPAFLQSEPKLPFRNLLIFTLIHQTHLDQAGIISSILLILHRAALQSIALTHPHKSRTW